MATEDELYERIRELEEEIYELKDNRDNTIKYLNHKKNTNKQWLDYEEIMKRLVGNVREDKRGY